MKKNTLFLLLAIILVILVYLQFNKKTLNIPFLKQSSKEQLVDLEKKPVEQGLTLEITEPKDKEVFKEANIKVSGKTKAGAEIFINDQETKANNNGEFSVDLVLDEGENEVTVVANDELGNYAEKTLTVELATPNN